MKKYHKNPRTLSAKQAAQLRRDLQELGDLSGIVHDINTDEIIGGNQRSEIIDINNCQIVIEKEYPQPTRTGTVAEGYVIWNDERYTYRRVSWTPAQCEKANIVANKAGGSWDFAKLAEEFDLDDLKDWGFDEDELKLLKKDPIVSTDDADPKIEQREELIKKYGVEYGQVWRLGDHRLICGDSASGGDVNAVMMGERASLIFTDPPYGVSIGSKNAMLNTIQPSGRCLENIEADEKTPEELKKVLLPAFINMREIVMADDCTVFVTAPQNGELGMMMMMMMREAGLTPRHVLIWKKNSPTFSMGRLDYDYQHEPILLTWLKRHKRPMNGTHKTSVWEIDKPRKCDVHPTMKPVELVVNALQNNSDPGDITFDAYCGSGTSIIAAEQTGRKCRAIEIDPGYVAVILDRFETATGKKPELIK
jgi:DNA modification methylase